MSQFLLLRGETPLDTWLLFLELQLLPRLLCVLYFNQKEETFMFHSKVSSLQAAPPWPLFVPLPSQLLAPGCSGMPHISRKLHSVL